MNRDLLAVATYADAHLNAFATGTIDMLKWAYKNNKGKDDCDVAMPSNDDNYLLVAYPSGKNLVMHGNALLCKYGNIADVYDLMGMSLAEKLPIIYDEWYR